MQGAKKGVTTEDLHATMLQMLKRLEEASVKFKKDPSKHYSLTRNSQEKLDLVGPVPQDESLPVAKTTAIPLSLPLIVGKGGGGRKMEELEDNQLEVEVEKPMVTSLSSPRIFTQNNRGQVEEKTKISQFVSPFSEAPINMINLTWAEKGKDKATCERKEKGQVDKPTKEIVKLPERPRATIIKGVVLCGKCQCECELEIPPTGAILDQELIKRKEKQEAHERARRVTARDTSRSVFQRLGGDSQPRALSEIFRDHEASEEAEDREAKTPRMKNVKPLQYGHTTGEDRRKDRITNPVTKDKPARLGRKWYVVGKNGQPIKEMGASMVRRVQRQHKAYMNSLKTPVASETSKNEKIEKTPVGGSQCHWRSKNEVERANSQT